MDFLKGAMERVKPEVERLIRRGLGKMTETNAKIHVLADETLGGIKREYVEVDRKAEVGEKIVSIFGNCPYYSEKEYGKVIYVDIDDAEVEFESKYEDESWYILHGAYHVLEPTDIVHIGTQRYELTDRKAEVGEKVIHLYEGESDGIAREVRKTDDKGAEVDPYADEEGWWVGFDHGYYRVLVPVEVEADEPQPADLIDVVSNLATRVADLERENKKLHAALGEDMKIRSENTRRYLALQDEIDTLHKDNRTLGEELERFKESTSGVKGEKLFTADELAAIIERLLMRP
ncbi:hypothetical protein [Bacillus subtilis]|uniref:hypothetical protein n=1 Tax=Bacillus subtilis TaxID=1423 RepID=UPI0037C154E8